MINPNYVDGLELRIKELTAERNAALAQNAELVAQVEYLKALLKEEAYEAYYEASDNNRADRMAEHFDNSVKKEFEKYWEAVGIDAKIKLGSNEYLRQIQADAGRAGWISSAKEYGAFYMYQTEVEEEANQYAASVKAGE